MSDLIITDDEEEVEADEIPSDAAPLADSPDGLVCRYCDEVFEGGFAAARRGRHEKSQHNAQWLEAKGQPAPKTPRTRNKKTPTDKPPRTPNVGALGEVRENVEFFYTMAGMGLGMRDEVCGAAFSDSAKNAAKAWVEVCKENERARKFWSGGSGSAAWIGLFMAHLPIIQTVQAHHIYPRLMQRQAMRDAAMAGYERVDADDLSGQAFQQDAGTVYVATEPEQPLNVISLADEEDSSFTAGGMG